MTGNLQFRRGIKSNLPTSAPNGMPLWCTDTKELYIGTDTGIHKIEASSDNSLSGVSSQKNVNILPTSGTINLEDNSVNTIVVSGNVNFILPEITDNTIFHEILVQVSMPNVVSFNMGTNNYLTSDPPDMSQSGLYNILFEFHQDTWFVASVKKNGVLGQASLTIDFEDYYGNFELNINNGQDYYSASTNRTSSFTLYYPKGTQIDYTIRYYPDDSDDLMTKTGTITLSANKVINVPDLFRSHEGIIDDLEDLLG